MLLFSNSATGFAIASQSLTTINLRLSPVRAEAEIYAAIILADIFALALATCRIMYNHFLRIIHFNILIAYPTLDQAQHHEPS